MSALIGRTCDVLWESCVNSTSGEWAGYTPHYHKIKMIRPACSRSEIVPVKIQGISADNKNLLAEPTSLVPSCCDNQLKVR